MIQKIAIFGDSWGCGSYAKYGNPEEKNEKRSDLTFQKLFPKDRYSVDNFSISGGTNLETIEQVNKHYQNYDFLIIFQTDPIRQYFKNYKHNANLAINQDLELPDAKSFEEFCELTLRNFYLELEKIDKPMLLIGGSAKLCFKYVPEKIQTLACSWTELVVPDFEDNYFYWTEPTLAVYDYARKKLNWKSSLADFAQYEDQIKVKNYQWHTHDEFTWCHSADAGYMLMFNKIMETLQNDNS